MAELAATDEASFTATYISGDQGGAYLVLSVHEIIADNTSREILLTDLFTAFTQQLAGEEILLSPTSAKWRDWSLRSGALATHPAVLDTCDFWLESASKATLRLGDREITGQPRSSDLVRLPSTLTVDETAELDDARRKLGVSMEEVLLAALGRTIADTPSARVWFRSTSRAPGVRCCGRPSTCAEPLAGSPPSTRPRFGARRTVPRQTSCRPCTTR